MGLALMIKEIYMPSLESKGDVKHQMGKFVNQIKTSITQAYGNVTINVPELPPNMNADEISRDPNLTEELSNAVVSNSI